MTIAVFNLSCSFLRQRFRESKAHLGIFYTLEYFPNENVKLVLCYVQSFILISICIPYKQLYFMFVLTSEICC